MAIDPADLPDFDIMLGGFPCQSFSIIGQREGMSDGRGQIIVGLAKILREKRPGYFLLENVKGLLNHDNGKTLEIIIDLLAASGYEVSHQLIRSMDVGIPQMRERVFLAGARSDLTSGFELRSPVPRRLRKLGEFLVDKDPNHELQLDTAKGETFQKYLNNKYNTGRHNLNDYLSEEGLVLDTLQSDLRIYRDVVPTLRTGRHGILYVRNRRLRCLSGLEALLLQGVPMKLAKKAAGRLNNRSLLSQAGNAITIPAVVEVAGQLFGEFAPTRLGRTTKRSTESQLALAA